MAQGHKTTVVDKRGAADCLTFNHPDVLSALSLEMVEELNDYFGKLYNDRTVRAVVIRGAGRILAQAWTSRTAARAIRGQTCAPIDTQ
jgi:enoyl-CoA hydratase/carnithine racemase